MSDKEKKGIGRLFGFKKMMKRPQVSEEEIREFVADNEELLEDEKRMIHEIIDLGDMAVREVMTPRVDVMAVSDEETVRAAADRMHGTGFSRLPVFHEDLDEVVGIVHYKDLVWALLDGKDDDLVAKYAYEPMFVPETKDIFPLLKEMQAARQQMAIVVDEYGGTDGLITIEDILEEIVGEIVDETDRETDDEDAMLEVVSPEEWLVDGRFPVEEAIELGWPVTDSDDYETIAGWLFDATDAVPQVGDEFVLEGFAFKIERMRRRRISSIRVRKVAELNTPEES